MNEKWSIGDGKNNAEWCVFKGGVCVASCSTEHGIFISEAQNIATKMNEIESLRQQLAAALAACKLKDEALNDAIEEIDSLSGRDNSCDPKSSTKDFEKTLAIQPDDTALKAWLGEPVAWECHTGEFCGGIWREKSDDSDTPIYSPKGLK